MDNSTTNNMPPLSDDDGDKGGNVPSTIASVVAFCEPILQAGIYKRRYHFTAEESELTIRELNAELEFLCKLWPFKAEDTEPEPLMSPKIEKASDLSEDWVPF